MKVVSSDLIRGNIDAVVLATLLDGKKYSMEIQKAIQTKTNSIYCPPEQTLYSAYHRLEDLGYIKGQWGDRISGTKRKYYTITQEGADYLVTCKMQWNNAKRLIDILLD